MWRGVAWSGVRCVSIRSSNRLQTGIVNNFSLFVVVTLRACNPIAFDLEILSRCHQICEMVGSASMCVLCFINTWMGNKNEKFPKPNATLLIFCSLSDWDWLRENWFWHWYLITLGTQCTQHTSTRNYATNKQKTAKNHTTSTMSNDHHYWNWYFCCCCFFNWRKINGVHTKEQQQPKNMNKRTSAYW